MPNFLKINLNQPGQNFIKLFCPDYTADVDQDVYWKEKGIDWDYVQANLEDMGYSITKAYTETLNFFLVPYIEEKYEDLVALIADKDEVDDYEILDNDAAVVLFEQWFADYVSAGEAELAAMINISKNEVENEEDLGAVLENLE